MDRHLSESVSRLGELLRFESVDVGLGCRASVKAVPTVSLYDPRSFRPLFPSSSNPTPY